MHAASLSLTNKAGKQDAKEDDDGKDEIELHALASEI
jgi:hypothetical protein